MARKTVGHKVRAVKHKAVKTVKYRCSHLSANNTPLLDCTFKESGQKFEKFSSSPYDHSSLPDTGSTKTAVSYDVAIKNNIKVHKRDNVSLSDTSKNAMKLEGVCYLKLKLKYDNGMLNKKGGTCLLLHLQ